MSVDLIFRKPPKTGPPWTLVFGEDDGEIVGLITANAGAPIVEITGLIDPLSIGTTVGSPWTTGEPIGVDVDLPWRDYEKLQAHTDVPWQEAQGLQTRAGVPWAQNNPLNAPGVGLPWQKAEPTEIHTRLPWQDGIPIQAHADDHWKSGIPVFLYEQRMPWQDAKWLSSTTTSLIHKVALRHVAHRSPWGLGRRLTLWTRYPWRQGIPLYSYGGPLPPVEPPEPPGEVCYEPDTELVFRELWTPNTTLVFKCAFRPLPPAGITVPVSRIYVVINDLILKKVAGDIILRCTDLNMNLDFQSWSWTFSATLGIQDFVHFPAGSGPIDLEAIINGESFRLKTQKVQRRRAFGRESISISGRGRIDELDAPTAPILSFGNDTFMTAAQLMDEVLKFNDVPIGWDVDFGLEDWDIDAGAWKMTGTYIEGLQKIAQAAGGYLQPHPVDKTVIVLPKYPVAPWDWGTVTPDIDLPAGPVSTEDIEFLDKPLYNRVFVSGQSVGVTSDVKIAGSDGLLVAPSVVDPLATRLIAGRQRAQAILGDTGSQAIVTLKLPVLSETGIILPGKFVRYHDDSVYRLGLVRKVGVAATLQEVWQTIGVETHV